jgi:hypothetical protein
MHKYIPVAEIELDEITGVIIKTGTLYNPNHVPVGINIKNGKPDRGDLNEWWSGRAIPASRQHIRQAISALGISSPGKLPSMNYGLSLSDQYWINPGGLHWDNINFFTNPFSEDVGNVLFGNWKTNHPVNFVSPDNTSDGWLKKKWKIIDGKRCLIKGGSDPFWQQPFNEVMASAILKRLRIPHVSYSLMWEEGLPYSVCENFITPETELVSAFNIHNTSRITNADDLYSHYINCCVSLGIPNARLALDRMLTADYLIANHDRHMNNFGAVRNAETLEWLMPAPLFDNGSSFWYNAAKIDTNAKSSSQPFLNTHDEQIKLVSDFSWLDINALHGAEDEFNDLLKMADTIDAGRRDALCLAFKNRVKNLRQQMLK